MAEIAAIISLLVTVVGHATYYIYIIGFTLIPWGVSFVE